MPPRRIRPFVAPQRAVEPPSTLRRVLAGATRVAGGLYPLGGPVGAGLAGGAEALAEKIEGTDVDPRRMAVEGAIGAVPLAKYIRSGRALASMLRTGAMTGVGEAGREYARGEELDPKAIAIATGLGGATGGVLGRIGGPKPIPKPQPPTLPRDPSLYSAYPLLPRTSKQIERLAVAAQAEGHPDIAIRTLKRAVDAGADDPRLLNRLLRVQGSEASKAKKAAEAAAAEDEIRASIEGGGLIPGNPVIREGIAAPIPGGKISQGVTYRQRPAAGTPQRAVFDTLVARGHDPNQALDEIERLSRMSPAREGMAATTDMPSGDVLGRMLSRMPAIGSRAQKGPLERLQNAIREEAAAGSRTTQEIPSVATSPAVAEEPTDFLTALTKAPGVISKAPRKPRTLKQQAQQDAYEALEKRLQAEAGGMPLAGPKEAALAAAAKGADELTALNKIAGIEDEPVPLGARGTAPVDPLAGMLRPEKTATKLGAAGIFESPVDVAGTVYRGAKGEPGLAKEARGYLGTSLEAEAEKAGLPVRRPGAQGRLAAFLGKELEPRLAASGEAIPPQGLSGAPQGGTVALEGPVEASRALPDRPLLSTTDLRQAIGVNEKTIDRWIRAGLIPGATRVGRQWRFRREEVLQAIESGTLGRPKAPTGGEAGFAVPELMMGMTGAAAGAITDPFDNPVISALAGAGTGLAVPHILAGIKSLGVAPETLGNVQEQLQTQEGIVGLAKRIARTLPHMQRANLLYSVPGLPANMWAGPWGAVMTGALTKALSGDPRGWAVLKSGDLWPSRFGKEWMASGQEALDLVRRADSKGTRFIEGAPVAQDVSPGPLRTYLETPAKGMAMGDVAARRILTRHGFSEDEARIMTLTSEPELPAMKKLAGLREGERSPFMEMLAPFVRTGANVVEGSAHATPLLGFITSSMKKNVPSVQEQLVTQGMGAAAGLGSYAIGNNIDPETARVLRRYITNVAGRQGLLAGLGFTAGQANRTGQPLVSPQTLRALEMSLPLPTAAPLTDLIEGVAGQGRVPRGAVPGVLYDFMYPTEARRRLRPISSGRRSGPRRRTE